MSVTILARIPQDRGKIVSDGKLGQLYVDWCGCRICAFDEVKVPWAAAFIEWEGRPFAVCRDCLARLEVDTNYLSGEDIPDREADDDSVFLISEVANRAGRGEWLLAFTSYRVAAAFYRRIELRTKDAGGLQPGSGVQERTREDAEVTKALDIARQRKEAEEEALYREDLRSQRVVD